MSTQVMHVVGARPNFPKAAPVHRALQERQVSQFLVHTGQHYSQEMSDVFFRQLMIPEPNANLGVGERSALRQIALIAERLEAVLAEARPEMVLVYGDVNSTLASAIAANKSGVSLAHVEAGLRSFDRTMPEEVNRVIVDQLADVLFATSEDAVENMLKEGLARDDIFLVGNPM